MYVDYTFTFLGCSFEENENNLKITQRNTTKSVRKRSKINNNYH